MVIPLECSCGQSYQIKDDLAGRRVRCPGCQQVLSVPAPEPERETEADTYRLADDSVDAATGIQTKTPEARPGSAYDPEVPPIHPARNPTQVPPRERSRQDEGPRIVFEEGWFGSVNSGVIGGVLMILIAVVWFFGGLAVGVIFFYPVILLMIGVFSIIKGLFGGE
jgi:hypothetical protein